ncbi:hypothetical protein ABTZ59_36065 [Streptomyces sp. NPDC094034]|uniref:hypothetical protein n=1 Tax=Streptomyces sp. NPDC094034 TaxID=3155309 RepID=UPI003323930A
MNSPAHNHELEHRGVLPWPARAQRRWPTMWRLAFVSLVAALSYILAGPTTAAAAPPIPPPSAADSPSARPDSRDWRNLPDGTWAGENALRLDREANAAADDFMRTAAEAEPRITESMQSITAKVDNGRLIGLEYRLKGEDSLKRKLATDMLKDNINTTHGRALGDIKDSIRYTMEVPAGNYTNSVQQAINNLQARGFESITFKNTWDSPGYKGINSTWRDPFSGQPFELQFHTADSFAVKMDNHVLYEKERLPGLSPDERAAIRAQQQEVFGKVPVPRDAGAVSLGIRGVDDGPSTLGKDIDGDEDGTQPAKRGPKTPTRGPGSTSAKTPKETVTSSTTPSQKRAISSMKPLGPGFRGSGRAGVAAQLGDLAGQAVMDYVSRKYQKSFEEALNDPARAQRLINEHNEYEGMNPFEQLVRSFTGKEFTEGELVHNGPKLIEVRKTHDRVTAEARKSNADPLYQQARTECGGYDTCVTERTDKLRKQNARAIADSTKKAKESNADPLYQQARTECGGYDTCVTDRTAKLRKQNAKAIADSTKKAKESNADPLYQQARTECGGYDTCVTDRVAKLRAQKKDATAKSDQLRTTDVHKTTTAKTGQTNQHKSQNAKAVADSTKKAKESNADPLYQQARSECGGYDTCVTDRVAKLRAQKKDATTATPTEQPKQSAKKKTQTSDYRGKGGVRAAAA